MAAPKKPQDHQPKSEKPKVERIDGGWNITHKGITVTVSEDAFGDYELFEDIARAETTEPIRMPSAVRRLFGDDTQKVLDGLRGENGRVSITDVWPFVKDVLEAISGNF